MSESVWDYPRPPRMEPVSDRIEVVFGGRTLARSERGYRVLEASHPPVYYFPPADVDLQMLIRAAGSSWYEFKGQAIYWSVGFDGKVVERVAWSYPNPSAPFSAIAEFLAFYASKMEKCRVGGKSVIPQEGDFYGGWITEGIVGPFKGRPGSEAW